MQHDATFDAIIAGGGPAGLSAALILGRCRRRVLLCDTGRPRNAAAPAVRGFLSRDGIPPVELRAAGRAQLDRDDSVTCRDVAVVTAERDDGGFTVTLADGTRHTARKLLLATGVVDHLPDLPGLASLYGHSVHHCPYCDGWETRDRSLAVYGRGAAGRDLVLCTDGRDGLRARDREQLDRNVIAIRTARIARLEGRAGQLARIALADGTTLARQALFLATGTHQHSDLPAQPGCWFGRQGTVRTGTYETTDVPGLYVAGDASRRIQLAIMAAAEGAAAAFAINTALLKEELA